MASSLTKMRMLTFFTTTATSPRMLGLGFPSRRHFSCRLGEVDPIVEELQNLLTTVDPSLVKLETSFAKSSPRVGSGVFVRPWLLVTSAHVVGRVTGFNCEVGRTAVTTSRGKVLRTRPLAVNFGGDVAVLHAVGDADSMPPPSPLAYDVGCKELPLAVFTRHESCTDLGYVHMKVREFEDTSPRTEWAYPVGDDFGWARYGGEQDLEKRIQIYPGSPWFSLLNEVVGIASWAVGKEPHGSPGNFVVPPPRIRAALDYAAKMGDQDRIVMDYWIEKVTTAADGRDDPIIAEECVSYVPRDFIATMYLPESLKAEIVKNINDD